jgi:hypothetical protein
LERARLQTLTNNLGSRTSGWNNLFPLPEGCKRRVFYGLPDLKPLNNRGADKDVVLMEFNL